jgi:hypothetical protein
MEIVWDEWDQATWDRGLIRAGSAPLQQSWNYGVAMAALGAKVRRGVVRLRCRDLALVQVLERRGIRLISRGPMWLEPVDAVQKRTILRALARHGGVTMATPGQAMSGCGMVPLITPRHHALWDLTPGIPALRAGLSASWRGHLAQAERRSLPIRQAGSDALDRLIAAEAARRKLRCYRALPGAFVRVWPAAYRQVWEWRDGQQIGAGMVFLRHGEWATYQMAWTSNAGRSVFAHGPMLWQAAVALRADGVRMLDLGDVSLSNPGLADFKTGTGATVVPLGATSWVLPGLRTGRD